MSVICRKCGADISFEEEYHPNCDKVATLEQRVKELDAELGVWENRETFWDETNKKLEAELSTHRVAKEYNLATLHDRRE